MKAIFFSGEVKATPTEDGRVTIEGWANKPIVDSMGDKMAFDKVDLNRFKRNPIMFFNHDRDMPIGKWLEWNVSDKGLWVKGFISNSKDAVISYIRDMVKEGILKTLSIGFEPKDEQMNRSEGYNEIKEWSLNEVSVVTLPANIEAEFALSKALNTAKNYMEAKRIIMKAQNPEEDPQNPEENSNKPEDKPPQEPPKNPDEVKASFQECVSAKIPKLIEEGKPQEQAVAIAMSMCREEGKCDISFMTPEMFAKANEIAAAALEKACKPKDPEKAAPGMPMPDQMPATRVSQPSDDPTNFGSPYIDLAKSQLALLGKISEQLVAMNTLLTRLLEKDEETSNDTGNAPDQNVPPMPMEGETSQKDLEKIKAINGRIAQMVKELKL